MLEISLKQKRAICKQDPILPLNALNSPRIQTCTTALYIFNNWIAIWMFIQQQNG